MTTSISPLRLENGTCPDLHSAVHCPNTSLRLAAQTTVASFNVLVAPCAKTDLISATQSETDLKEISCVPHAAVAGTKWLSIKLLMVWIEHFIIGDWLPGRCHAGEGD